jgi:hypothetical protein
LSAEADPNPARKTRERVLTKIHIYEIWMHSFEYTFIFYIK